MTDKDKALIEEARKLGRLDWQRIRDMAEEAESQEARELLASWAWEEKLAAYETY